MLILYLPFREQVLTYKKILKSGLTTQ